LSAALRVAHEAWRAGETRAFELESRMRHSLAMTPRVMVEYIAIVEPIALAPVDKADASTVVAIAARVGHTRLIDNIIMGEGVG
jgi:pantothenate synthetase